MRGSATFQTEARATPGGSSGRAQAVTYRAAAATACWGTGYLTVLTNRQRTRGVAGLGGGIWQGMDTPDRGGETVANAAFPPLRGKTEPPNRPTRRCPIIDIMTTGVGVRLGASSLGRLGEWLP